MRGLTLLGIFALTLILRLWGFAQGYPGFYGHVDEIGVAASIWNFFRAATLQPTEFTYPAFYSYLVAAGLWLTHAMGWGPDLGRLSESLIFISYLDPGRVALVGRVLSAVLSALVPLLTYALGKEAFNARVGSIAALFMAVALVPVVHAHQALPDSAMALGAALCFYCSWRIYTHGSWRYYLLAGFVAGLVVATKYNGAFTALAIPAAHWLRSDRTLWSLLVPKLCLAIFIALLALFVGSPYLFLASDKYWALVNYQISSLDFALGERTPWWWIVRSLPQVEWLVGGLMLGGMVWSIYRREALDWILWAAWLPSFLYIGSWTRESLHYLLHFYPLWALGAARLLAAGGGVELSEEDMGGFGSGRLLCIAEHLSGGIIQSGSGKTGFTTGSSRLDQNQYSGWNPAGYELVAVLPGIATKTGTRKYCTSLCGKSAGTGVITGGLGRCAGL